MNEIKIDNKIKDQISHIFKFYEDSEIQEKLYHLAFDWYIKGFHLGLSILQKENDDD